MFASIMRGTKYFTIKDRRCGLFATEKECLHLTAGK